MPVRSSSAVWNGNLLQGSGTMKLGSGAYEGAYSFVSRFESGKGTNPEELIAAAHAGCYSMAFSATLGKAQIATFPHYLTAQFPAIDPQRVVGLVPDLRLSFGSGLDVCADAAVPEQIHRRFE